MITSTRSCRLFKQILQIRKQRILIDCNDGTWENILVDCPLAPSRPLEEININISIIKNKRNSNVNQRTEINEAKQPVQ